MNTIKKITGIVFVMLMIISCDDPLDKMNLSEITSGDMWENPQVAEGYVNNIYASLMPGFPGGWGAGPGIDSDEAMGLILRPARSGYLLGTITSNSGGNYSYDIVRKINIFLDGIDEASFDPEIKNRLKGEALFWRAWAYFNMVRAHGGVPLILQPESPDGDLFVPRNKTSECFTQIIKDLDDAIELVEDKSDIGRIDKCASMAFKGRVLLFRASPQFNRNSNMSLWQDAYNANKEALSFLNSQGKGLFEDYRSIWFTSNEMNKEVIMVRRYEYPAFSNGRVQSRARPLYWASGGSSLWIPSLELVNAYPMKDGSSWDTETMDYRKLHQNRDSRFYATIAYNGAPPYFKDLVGNTNLWTYWYDKDGDPSTGINGKEFADFNEGNYFTYSSFYSAKMIDQNVLQANVFDGGVDWVEIRYAEVLMNMAEAANEIGNTSEALDALYQIRERADIEAGEGKYGIAATSVNEIRLVIQDERFIEFAFEQKRFWDLRRWRIYKSRMEGLDNSIRHGLRIEFDGSPAERPTGLIDLDEVWDKFNIYVVEDNVPKITMLEEDKYSFFGIATSILERNSKLEQNNTWGGNFDPLE